MAPRSRRFCGALSAKTYNGRTIRRQRREVVSAKLQP
jgi:hypothetical protein